MCNRSGHQAIQEAGSDGVVLMRGNLSELMR